MILGYRLTLAVLLKRFARAKKGSTVVEFALLAFPFFGLLMAILETTFVFLAYQILEGAVQDSARTLRTGQAQTFSIDDFRNRVCYGTYGLFDCTKLHIDVRTIDSFESANFIYPIDPNTGEWTSASSFSPGESGSVVLVSVHYKWQLFMDFLGMTLADSPNGENARILGANSVVKNEPF